MSDSKTKTFSQTETYKSAQKKAFKYPSEEETFVRRLGSAVLACWGTLPPEIHERIMSEALKAWDREYHIPGLEKKIESFIKRYPSRLG